jgi:2,4-dienoyl-CoA reductase-like NADH-dependent reductase (Old Yellow Enzyme family)
MSKLFTSFSLRDVEFRNRVFVSPMCQYSCEGGIPTNWHLVHLGSRAVGGAGLVMAEGTGVSPEGRITPGDAGLWNEEQARAFAPIAAFVKEAGAIAGIQLAHAGRKASTNVPWRGGGKPLAPDEGAWEVVGPSATPFDVGWAVPREATAADLQKIVHDYERSASLASKAGFQVVELHFAHGYLAHSFLSPLSNRRTDGYGGPQLVDRARLPLRIAEAVRAAWPPHLPMFVRISCTDWVEGGWDLPQSIQFARWIRDIGVDLIDCSSGGLVSYAKIPNHPGTQVPFAAAIRRDAKIAVGAVGGITAPEQAEQIVANEQADVVFLAREMLRNPYWALRAASALKDDVARPSQYDKAKF